MLAGQEPARVSPVALRWKHGTMPSKALWTPPHSQRITLTWSYSHYEAIVSRPLLAGKFRSQRDATGKDGRWK